MAPRHECQPFPRKNPMAFGDEVGRKWSGRRIPNVRKELQRSLSDQTRPRGVPETSSFPTLFDSAGKNSLSLSIACWNSPILSFLLYRLRLGIRSEVVTVKLRVKCLFSCEVSLGEGRFNFHRCTSMELMSAVSLYGKSSETLASLGRSYVLDNFERSAPKWFKFCEKIIDFTAMRHSSFSF